jgi:tetraacyldisaccharide 4'-kinase
MLIKDSQPPFVIDKLLAFPGALYSGLMRGRNFAYDHAILASHQVDVPVISIGNLTAGGTGKTPITSLLIEGLSAKGLKVGVISRGYGGKSKGCERVRDDGSPETAKWFGDEPTWLAHRHSDVPVFVGRDKVAASQALLREYSVQLILADDAFQHRRLKRDFDIVLLDATQPEWHYRSLPQGRLREGFSSLARAHAVFVTKTNLAQPRALEFLRSQLSSQTHLEVFEFESLIRKFTPLHETADKNSDGEGSLIGKKRLLLVSGIGRPETFSTLVSRAFREWHQDIEIIEHVVFRDHHAYSDKDLVDLEKAAERISADAILMTEKDAVKLNHWQPSVPSYVSQLVSRPRLDLEGLYEAIRRLTM